MPNQLTLDTRLHNRFNLPQIFLWPVLLLCILPSAYVLAVYPILSPNTAVSTNGHLFFNIWLILGISAAFITGILAFVDYIVKKDAATPLVGGILLCTSFFSLLPFLVSNKLITVPAAIAESLDFSWFISRLFHAVLITSGTWYFVKLSRKSIRTFEQKNQKLTLVFIIYGILTLALTVWYLFGSVPELRQLYSFLTHPFELVTITVYLFWGFFILPHFLNRFSSIFSRMLVLSVIPAVFAQVFMAIYQQPFDKLFNLAYFFHFLSYLVPLAGICMNYIETSKKEKQIINRLNAEVRERVEAQRSLEKRETMLNHAEEIARLGSWELDTASAAVKWSDELFKIYGYEPEKIMPSWKLQEEIIIPSYREKVRKELAAAIRNKTSFSIEYTIQRPDGQIRHLLGKGNCLKGNKLVGTLLDITELKEATQKLLQNEALLREAEAISHNGSWEYIISSNSMYWSDEAYRIHGLLPGSQEISPDFYQTLIHPDDLDEFKEKIEHAYSRQEPLKIEYKIIRLSGEIRHVLLSGKFKHDISGSAVKAIGNIQDITEIKNTTQQLDKSESIYRTIAKNVPGSIVFLFDKTGDLLLTEGPIIAKIQKEANDTSVSVFQYLLTEDDKQKFEDYFKEALKGKEFHYESRLKGRIYKINFTPVHNSSNEIFGVMIVMNDITDIKRTQNDLESKVSELNRSNNELEQFAYVASHDLQEPLRKIRAFGERLKTKFELQLPAEGQDYINRMTNASERMQVLIDDLLTFSRISRSTEEFKTLNLEEIIRGVISDLELVIEKKQAAIKVNAGQLIKAIPSQMRQLFQNLISNSIKFTKEDTEPVITINAFPLTAGEAAQYPYLHPDKAYCIIRLRDNGIGFDEQYKDKIFVLFQRLHTRSEYEGTGIGLAVCKKIVDNHGGIISADSREGEGAEFTIILPVEG